MIRIPANPKRNININRERFIHLPKGKEFYNFDNDRFPNGE
jgi:hypothetical protein